MSPTRSLVVGTIGSYRDCWAFRATIAKKLGCSVRTVQRAITQAKELGLIRVFRSKKGEKPPNWDNHVWCGFSHKVVVGWGLAGAAVKRAVELARGLRLVRKAMADAAVPAAATVTLESSPAARPRTAYQRRHWTAEELDAELARLERLRAPPD